jgi:hypothetical protein
MSDLGINQVIPQMIRRNLVSSAAKSNRRSIANLCKSKRNSQASFEVQIKRRNKESSPILSSKNGKSRMFIRPVNSPVLRLSDTRIWDFSSPSPMIIKMQGEFKTGFKRKFNVQSPHKNKVLRFFKNKGFTSQLKNPKMMRCKMYASPGRRKNISHNNLADLLEIRVKNHNPSVKTPKKRSKEKSIEKQSTSSFEDLGKGFVLIVSGENEIQNNQETKAIHWREPLRNNAFTNTNLTFHNFTRELDNSENHLSETEQKAQNEEDKVHRKISLLGSTNTTGMNEMCQHKSTKTGIVFSSENYSNKEVRTLFKIWITNFFVKFWNSLIYNC